MKKTILKSVLVAILATSSIISCSSEPVASNENNIVSKPPPPGLTQFYYIQNGALNYTSISNPYAEASSKTIFGKKGSLNVIEIRLSSLAVGTYFIGGSNKFFYKKPFITNTWTATTGKVTISFNAYGQLSGSYTMTSGSGISGVTSVDGYFEYVTINP